MVEVSWQVEGTDDKGEVTVPPEGAIVFTTAREGPTQLY